MDIIKLTPKPNEINTSNELMGSDFKKCEIEVIATNIIKIHKARNEWTDFSWEEYKNRCSHKVSNKELEILNSMVERGYLHFNTDTQKYGVNLKFLSTIDKFRRK